MLKLSSILVKVKISKTVFMNKVRNPPHHFHSTRPYYLVAKSRARELLATIEKYLDDHRRGEIIRSGIRLTIFGPPNAGKSSLLNFLGKNESCKFVNALTSSLNSTA